MIIFHVTVAYSNLHYCGCVPIHIQYVCCVESKYVVDLIASYANFMLMYTYM